MGEEKCYTRRFGACCDQSNNSRNLILHYTLSFNLNITIYINCYTRWSEAPTLADGHLKAALQPCTFEDPIRR